MTEMVYGAAPAAAGDPILPRWWRTVDKLTMTCILLLFGIGLLLGLAASPPLAARNGLEPFYYVQRQAFFGILALIVMFVTSMMSPNLIRRLGVLGFVAAFVALALLPVLGTDFGKGATRWYSLGFASIQPSEFLKPGFIVLCAWMMAASQQINGPPGRRCCRFCVMMTIVVISGDAAGFWTGGCLILFGWSVMYFVVRRADDADWRGSACRWQPIWPAALPINNSDSILRGGSTGSCRPDLSIRAPSLAMPPMRSARAGCLASAWARGR